LSGDARTLLGHLTPAIDPHAIGRVRSALLAWGDQHRRDLPWRSTRDPWAILVSEIMLQQTQVDRVVPKYEAFLERFPTANDCAAAPPADVIALWQGLGYNRRALNLHRCAVAVSADHGGRIPGDLDALLALPGIGPYTARAVLTFAFEVDVGVVDTNVGRILARVVGARLAPSEAQRLADELVPPGDSWRWNQAMFDLGAGICGRKTATCVECPVAADCAWRGQGPDPAIASAGVSGRQSKFEGSDRQGRGRLIAHLTTTGATAVDVDHVADLVGWPGETERAAKIVEQLKSEGLIEVVADRLRLPQS